jgi:hypothetical protein
VELIAGFGMLKRNQVRSVAQARSGDEKTHVNKYPANNTDEDRMPEDWAHVGRQTFNVSLQT